MGLLYQNKAMLLKSLMEKKDIWDKGRKDEPDLCEDMITKCYVNKTEEEGGELDWC